MRSGVSALLVRLLVVAGLAVDLYAHLHLAARYNLAAPGGVGAGTLFRVEAGSALLALLLVALRPSRRSYGFAAIVALGGAAAVVLYRYVDVPAVGPIPSMYEPIWFLEKTLSAVAEVIAGVAAVIGVLISRPARRSP